MKRLLHTVLSDDQLPTIAIGILSHNRYAQLIRSLNGFLRSDYPPEKLHITVIDNASSDGTAERVREYFGERVRVLELPENMGGVARNRALLNRDERYVFVFDEDCMPEHRSTIRNAVSFLETNPYFEGLCFRSINSYSGLTEYGPYHKIARRRLGNDVVEGIFVIGNGMGFRREAMERSRGYDERLFWGSEEYSLGLETIHCGIPIAYSPDFAILHHHAPRAMPPAQVMEAEARNNVWIPMTHFPIPIGLAVVAQHLLYRVLPSALKGNTAIASAALRGAWRGLKELPAFLATRRPITVGQLAMNNRWFVELVFPRRNKRPFHESEDRR